MNLRYRVTPDEEAALRRSTAYVRANYTCPTCQNTGYYTYQGQEHECKADEDGACIRYKLFRLYVLANIPKDYMQLDWNDYTLQPEGKKSIDTYVDHLPQMIREGVGMYLWSENLGTGKTFCATHVLKEAAKLGLKGYFLPFFDVIGLHQMEDTVARNYIDNRLKSADILVIDDVVPGKVSVRQAEHFEMKLEEILRHRVHNGLSTIVTSNMPVTKLKGEYARIFSLLQQASPDLELAGKQDARVVMGVDSRLDRVIAGEVRPIT